MPESEFGAASHPRDPRPASLKNAMREARIEAAERTGVVVDLHDAEFARLEMLNDALDPIFAEVPAGVEVFDRGLMPGEPPRLWIDMIAHVSMGRDKRVYRFLQDTRYGRRVLAESPQVEAMAQAITHYVARRLVERERALAGDTGPMTRETRAFASERRKRRWKSFGLFLLGMIAGAAALLGLAWFLEPMIY
ncbi:MAG: hypothetical protein IT536_06655 [Hyphomicrobiales bacterium]|nr:hypothetical protein [Hyphomicrobiales bacterium]